MPFGYLCTLGIRPGRLPTVGALGEIAPTKVLFIYQDSGKLLIAASLIQAPKGTHCIPYGCQVQAHEPAEHIAPYETFDSGQEQPLISDIMETLGRGCKPRPACSRAGQGHLAYDAFPDVSWATSGVRAFAPPPSAL